MKTINTIFYSAWMLGFVMIAHLLPAQGLPSGNVMQIPERALTFLVMGDWGRNGEDYQKEVAVQMGKTAAEVHADFIISTGDNFYPSGVASEFDPLWKYSYEDVYTAFSLQWDWYPVLGNHDYKSNPDAQVAYTNISRRWKMPARYYAKTFNIRGDSTEQVLIAFIDTNPLIRGFYTNPEYGPNVKTQDSTEQKLWLEKLLSDPSPAIKWKIVVGHHPMFTAGGRTEAYDTKAIRGSLQTLLERYNVDAYLSGHEHSLQHLGPVNGVHHFVSGSASERTPVKHLTISKLAVSEYGFMVFTVTTDALKVRAISHQGAVLYNTEIKKPAPYEARK